MKKHKKCLKNLFPSRGVTLKRKQLFSTGNSSLCCSSIRGLSSLSVLQRSVLRHPIFLCSMHDVLLHACRGVESRRAWRARVRVTACCHVNGQPPTCSVFCLVSENGFPLLIAKTVFPSGPTRLIFFLLFSNRARTCSKCVPKARSEFIFSWLDGRPPLLLARYTKCFPSSTPRLLHLLALARRVPDLRAHRRPINDGLSTVVTGDGY